MPWEDLLKIQELDPWGSFTRDSKSNHSTETCTGQNGADHLQH
jgi:hypothetical protein